MFEDSWTGADLQCLEEGKGGGEGMGDEQTMCRAVFLFVPEWYSEEREERNKFSTMASYKCLDI